VRRTARGVGRLGRQARLAPAHALALVFIAASVVGFVLSPDLSAGGLLEGALTVGFSGTGALIVVRQPHNSIGWLFLAIGLASGLAILAPGLADHGLEAPGAPSTATKVFAAYSSASWVPMMLPGLTFLLLLFPDGHLLSRRWRWMARIAAAGLAIGFFGTLVAPGPLEDYPQLRNPLGIESAKGLDGPGIILLFVAVIGSPLSLVLRFRRADGVTREQIKWLAFAGAMAALVFIIGVLVSDEVPEEVLFAAMMSSVLLIPLAAGVAILRYRLYDIDVVIHRALVYAGLTATLVAAYLVTVLLAQLVLPARGDLGVAVSTLAAAAVFAPARRRIQSVVDQRFFRRRYDAERTLEAFGSRLRDEVDLSALSNDLRGVVAETMQPAHVSLWLRTL
jgi:hypothetical protein